MSRKAPESRDHPARSKDEGDAFYREATVWVEGLDRIHKHRGINLCVDLSATPYYLGRVGQDANRPFPWVVSDFGLVDSIESGLVKIPQLAVRDTSGKSVPGYFNIWRWILPRLTPAERGGRRASVKPEAVFKYAHVPLAMLGGLWETLREEWEQREDESRPPVFIIVCKNTALAKVIYRWLAEDDAPVGVPPAHLEIRFPRVEGYTQGIRHRVTVDWESIAPLPLDPMDIPPEVEMKAGLPSNTGRPSLVGPGRLERIDLNPYREGQRLQRLVFQLARDLTRDYLRQPGCDAPPHVLFTQIASTVIRYLGEKVRPVPPARDVDAFLSPCYGWLMERLIAAIRPDDKAGGSVELPRVEQGREPDSTVEVDFETRREPYPVVKSHINAVVPDTRKWEQSAAYRLDTHALVRSFVKNAGLGFAIPYLHNGEHHEYLPDFIVRLASDEERYLVLETKGYDPLQDVKTQAAWRWVRAVNTRGCFGTWSYAVVSEMNMVGDAVRQAAE